ncbi:MAG: hypothetical protein A3F67_07980 [Verrucomicrobia bacterium RIFCSPHIGHO2_12_FULL_41_10]|nr:MAG: hypothetical protein A3F67_07980 [Verrucomicrobia bacterium RIFCSPHIGHO2_12_FULL_41_10]HLB33790.1 hypothetical protein [Chthoniobacterales bacterium]
MKFITSHYLFFCLLISSQLSAISLSNIEDNRQDDVFHSPSSVYKISQRTINTASKASQIAPKLQMNPATLEAVTEGIATLKKGLGCSEVLEDGFLGDKGSCTALAASSPSKVFKLKDEVLPAKTITQSLKVKRENDGEDEEEVEDDINEYFKKEICDNIYATCLAKVAAMSFHEREFVEGALEISSAEAYEWAAAEKAADFSKRKAERALEKVRQKIEEARRNHDEAKRSLKEALRVPHQEKEADQSVAMANINYEKARVAHIASNYEATKLAGVVAEAKVEMADAVFYAISVRNSSSHSAAEAEIDEIKKTEEEALDAFEIAKADVMAKADLLKIAEENLNAAKKAAQGVAQVHPLSPHPITAAQKSALKDIIEDQTLAETGRTNAKKTSFTATTYKIKVDKGEIEENSENLTKELELYEAAKSAWEDTVRWYKAAYEKAERVAFDTAEFTEALNHAEKESALWKENMRWVQERKIAAATEASRIEEARIQEEINIKARHKEEAEAKVRAAQAKEQGNAAKVASEASNYSEKEAWNKVVEKTEQASESWLNVSEALSQGNRERALSWKTVAEQLEKSLEEWKKVAQHCASNYSNSIRGLEDFETEAFIGDQLSHVERSRLQSKEALEQGNASVATLWQKAAEQYQDAAEYYRQVNVVDRCDQELTFCCSNTTAISARLRADQLEKAAKGLAKSLEITKAGNTSVVTLWQKISSQHQVASEYYKKHLEASLAWFSDYQLKKTDVNFKKSLKAVKKENNHFKEESYSEEENYFEKEDDSEEENYFGREDDYEREDDYGRDSLFEKENSDSEKTSDSYSYGEAFYEELALDRFYQEISLFKEAGDSAASHANQLEKAVINLEKSQKASQEGNEPIATLLGKSVEQYQNAVEYGIKSVEAIIKRNKKESTRFNSTSMYTRISGDALEKAATNLEKLQQVIKEGNASIATLLEKSVDQCKVASEYYQKSAEATVKEKEKEIYRFGNAGDSAMYSVYRLDKSVESLEKAQQATKEENFPLAMLLEKAAEQYQVAAEYSKKLTEAIIKGKTEQSLLFEKVSELSDCSSDGLENAISSLDQSYKVGKEGDALVAALWARTTAQYQLLADHYQKKVKVAIKEKPAKHKNFDAEDDGSSDEKVSESDLIRSGADNFKKAAESLYKSHKVAKEGNQSIATLWEKNAEQYQYFAVYYQKAVEDINQGNKEESTDFKKLVRAATFSTEQLEQTGECLEESRKATKDGNSLVAILWKKNAEQYQYLAEYGKKNIEAIIKGNEQEMTSFEETDEFVRKSTDKLEEASKNLKKAQKVTKKGDDSMVALFGKNAEQYQHLAEYWREGAETNIAGNQEKIECFNKSNSSSEVSCDKLREAAEILETAQQKSQEGNQYLVMLLRESAEQNQLLAEYWRKFAEAEATDDKEKVLLFEHTTHAIWDSSMHLSKALKSIKRSQEITKERNESIAMCWGKGAEKWQLLAEHARKSAEAKLAGDQEEVKHLELSEDVTNYSVDRLEQAAKSLEESLEAVREGNTPLSILWQQNAEQYYLLDEYFQAHSKVTTTKNAEDFSYESEASIRFSVDQLKQAVQSLEKSLEASEEELPSVAVLWQKAAEQYQVAAEHYRKGAEAYTQGHKKEADRLGGAYCIEASVASSAKSTAEELEKAAESLTKSLEATAEENDSVANLWKKTEEQYQIAAEYSKKSAEAQISGNKKEPYFNDLMNSARWIADQLENAAKTFEQSIKEAKNNNKSVAEFWKKSSEQHLLLSEYWRRSMEVYIKRNKKETACFTEAADIAADSANCLEKAAESLEKYKQASGKKGNEALTVLWQKITEHYQIAAEHYRKGAEAIAGGVKGRMLCLSEASFLKNNADKLIKVAESTKESLEAASEGHELVSALWRKAAEQYQIAIEYNRKQKETESIEDQESMSLFSEGISTCLYKAVSAAESSAYQLENAAQSLKKSVEATEEENASASALWQKIAEQYKVAAEYYRKGAEAFAQGNEEEGCRLGYTSNYYEQATRSAGECAVLSACELKNSIEHLEKSLEVTEEKSSSERRLWQKTAEQCQIAAEYYRKGAEAFAQGNEEEGKKLAKRGKEVKKEAYTHDD